MTTEMEIANAFTGELPLNLLVRSRTNPRTRFEPVALQSLADSIKAQGIGQPLLVRSLPGSRVEETAFDRKQGDPLPTHEIIAGERRYRAAAMAGLTTVPVLVRELTDSQVLHMQLVENVQREDLHPIEEALGYRNILDLPEQDATPMKERVAALAGEIKKSTRYIYQTLQLLQLCEFARKAFLEGHLVRTTALQIARIGNDAQQIEATKTIAGLANGRDPMHQRQAEDYVNRTFMLVLSKANFPITVALAGAPACGECPKNSANAAELFDEGKAGPATCMDPSCYGKKNVAHNNQVAEAARKDGQRVITGRKAKEIIPHTWDASRMVGFAHLDAKRFDVIDKLQGQTLRQILKGDFPKPVLIQGPDGDFLQCLPEADAKRLLKERKLMHGRTENNEQQAKQRETNRKLEEEKSWRREAAAQLVARAGELKPANLLAALMPSIALQVYTRLDNECSKRVRKLMEWDDLPRGGWHSDAPALQAFFEVLPPEDLNRFFVASCLAGEMHVAEYCKPGTAAIDAMATMLEIDVGAIKKKLKDDAKAAASAKAAKAKKAAPAPVKAEAKAAKPAPWDQAAGKKPPAKKAATKANDTTGDLLASAGESSAFTLNQLVRVKADVPATLAEWVGRKGQVRGLPDAGGVDVRFKGRKAGLVTFQPQQLEGVK